MRGELDGVVKQSALLFTHTGDRPAALARNPSAIGSAGIDFGATERSFQGANVAGEVMEQLDANIEANYESDVLLRNNVLQKRPADLLLHVEHVLLATTGVNQNTERQGQIRVRRKILDDLRLAILQD